MTELRHALGDEAQRIIRTVPRRGYRFVAPLAAPRHVHRGPGAPVPARRGASAAQSLAMLPFVPLDLSDREAECLGLGMADALILRLAGVGGLVVRPTSAVLRFAGVHAAAAAASSVEAGRALGVDAILEGHVLRSGRRLRVTAQLIDLRDEAILWAERFDEDDAGVFEVQDSIALKVVGSLLERLGGAGPAAPLSRWRRHGTASREAHLAYLRGRFCWARRTEASLTAAVRHFREAIALDGGYALAHAGLADALNVLGAYAGALRPREAFLRAREAALVALELEPGLAEAHASMAFAKAHGEHDWAGAEAGYRRAIELAPGYATARQWYALCHAAQGRFGAALCEARAALEADPLSLIVATDVGRHLYYAGRYDEAAEQLRRTIELDPAFFRAHLELGRVQRQMGEHASAVAELRRAVALSDQAPAALGALAAALAGGGRTCEARAALAGLSGQAARGHVSAYHVAVAHAGLGERRQALGSLWKAYDERFNWLVFIGVEPEFAGLRDDPAFSGLIARLGLAT
jgi:TolB-like protein/Tfp pilus assembly protein PilF